MNAITLEPKPTLPDEPFIAAELRVNEWRGRCLGIFAKAEATVTDCLLALAAVEGRGQQVGLPYLVGQRLEALSSAFAVGAPFEVEGRPAARALAEYREHDALRPMLCHGVFTLTLDRRGTWTIVLRLTALRSRCASRETMVLTEAEAEAICNDLRRKWHQLSCQLGTVRASLRK